MKTILLTFSLTFLLVGCSKTPDKDITNQPSKSQEADMQTYKSTSEVRTSTVAEEELNIINQPGTANGEGL